ncbi:MAG: response regulator [Candidatus Omnitrophica bacterium]|nr:response regulator [Candidatus Omnitrophota bacterium]
MENRPNILIVDDDKDVVEAVAKYIAKRYEATIDIAFNGSEAISRSDKTTYDIILLDVKMPGMDGISILKEVRKKNKTAHIIIITAWHSSEVLNDALSFGANAFLVKPVSPNLLKSRLDHSLSSINKLKHLL